MRNFIIISSSVTVAVCFLLVAVACHAPVTPTPTPTPTPTTTPTPTPTPTPKPKIPYVITDVGVGRAEAITKSMIMAHVELRNTSNTTAYFDVSFELIVDGKVLVDSESAYVFPGDTKTFWSEVEIEKWEELDSWSYEVTVE